MPTVDNSEIKVDDLSQLNGLTVVRIKSFRDNNPFKATVHNYTVEADGTNEPRLKLVSLNADSYSSKGRRTNLTYDLLNDPTVEVKFYDFLSTDHLIYAESTLETITRSLKADGLLHQSNYFKFDIDGKEHGWPGFKFSEMKQLPHDERFVHKNGFFHVTEKEQHRPVPLRIAKYETPPTIQLKNGRSLKITHITELGELIYNAQGLKSVDKSLIVAESLELLLRKTLYDYKMAPALEDFLVGDIAKHRHKFLEAQKQATHTYSM